MHSARTSGDALPHRLPDAPDFATLLRACRVAAGLSQEALAERAGVTERSVRNIERGAVRSPRPETVQLIGAALGFDGAELADFVARARARYWAERGQDRPPPSVAAPAPAGPAQLPMEAGGFTGRAAELAALDEIVAGVDRAPAVIVSAVSGTAGVGKTALTLRWAHSAAARFPDGQLYVNLRGYDPQHPMSPGDALVGFLTALGVKRGEIPFAVDDRAALYRSRLNGRRMLVLLDNAATVDQVRPLLPGSPTCVTAVTSRDSLSGLVALYGARRVDLGRLPLDEAVALLRRVVGERVDAEPEAAAQLAEQCVRLPLALRVAAELAAVRPHQPLSALVAELGDGQQRLELLAAGHDERAAIRAVFSWSYRHLPPGAAATFRVLGLHPGADFDRYAAAALAGSSPEAAEEALGLLLRAHLVEQVSPGRYALHDLLRAYARSLVGDDEQAAALGRLFAYYLAMASAAMDVLYPGERDRRPRVTPAKTALPAVDDGDAARDWLSREMANLVKTGEYGADHAWTAYTTDVAATLYRFLSGDHFLDGLALHGHAVRAARVAGDRAAEATSLANLGVTYWLVDRYEEAAELLREAIPLHRLAGDPASEARSLNNLALVYQWAGDQALAAEYLEQALPLQRALGDRSGAAKTVGNLGNLYWFCGRHADAVAPLEEALEIHRELADHFGEAMNRNALGLVQTALRRYDVAAEHYRLGLALFRGIGHRAGEAHVLSNLSNLDNILGRYGDAAARQREALVLFRQSGDRAGEASALTELGTALLGLGSPAEARPHFAAALSIGEDTRAPREQALAHEGLARVCEALGEAVAARGHWQAALALVADTDETKAARIRAVLGG